VTETAEEHIRGDISILHPMEVNIVEFQIEGVAQHFLPINSDGSSAIPLQIALGLIRLNDTGDFTIAAKFKLQNESSRGPAKQPGELGASGSAGEE
jgi:hypothetical protein